MAGPFGVELPENLGQAPEQNAAPQHGSPEGSAPEGNKSLEGTNQNTQTPAEKAQELADLDKLEKFRFKGREWTRKEFEDGHLRQQDYTRKMQTLSEKTKFVENFPHDLRTVIADRSKLSDLERIYPKEFVAHAKEILAAYPAKAEPQGQQLTSKPEVPEEFRKEFDAMKASVAEWQQERERTEIEQNQKWLNNQFDSLSKKYSHAHSEVVYARAESAARQGVQITADVLDKLFKACNDEMKKRSDELYKDKINQQLKAGKEAKDVGAGGDLAGGAPKNYKTIKDATAGFLADIANRS